MHLIKDALSFFFMGLVAVAAIATAASCVTVGAGDEAGVFVNKFNIAYADMVNSFGRVIMVDLFLLF